MNNSDPATAAATPLPEEQVRVIAGRMGQLDILRKLMGPRADRINPRVFHYWPQGHRVTIAMDHIPETLDSGLHVPDETRNREQLTIGAGIVIACGASAGLGEEGAPRSPVPHPGAPALHPRDLLYQHVLFSPNAGSYIRMSFAGYAKDDVHVCVVNDRDIWFLDDSPPEEWEKVG